MKTLLTTAVVMLLCLTAAGQQTLSPGGERYVASTPGQRGAEYYPTARELAQQRIDFKYAGLYSNCHPQRQALRHVVPREQLIRELERQATRQQQRQRELERREQQADARRQAAREQAPGQ
jgi:hypothetical protein